MLVILAVACRFVICAWHLCRQPVVCFTGQKKRKWLFPNTWFKHFEARPHQKINKHSWWISGRSGHSQEQPGTARNRPELSLQKSCGWNTSELLKCFCCNLWGQRSVSRGFEPLPSPEGRDDCLLNTTSAAWTIAVIATHTHRHTHSAQTDVTTCILNSRRRSSTCFGAPYKPKRAVCCFLKCSLNPTHSGCMLSQPQGGRVGVFDFQTRVVQTGGGSFFFFNWSALFLVAETESTCIIFAEGADRSASSALSHSLSPSWPSFITPPPPPPLFVSVKPEPRSVDGQFIGGDQKVKREERTWWFNLVLFILFFLGGGGVPVLSFSFFFYYLIITLIVNIKTSSSIKWLCWDYSLCASLCVCVSLYVWVCFWSRQWNHCYTRCFSVTIVSSLASFFSATFVFCFFPTYFYFFLSFHILPHGPIESPVFLFIIGFCFGSVGALWWRVFMHINGTSKRRENQIIYKWNVLSANRTVVGWSQPLVACFIPKHLWIRMCFYKYIYILSVVMWYVFYHFFLFCFVLFWSRSFCFDFFATIPTRGASKSYVRRWKNKNKKINWCLKLSWNSWQRDHQYKEGGGL